MSNSVKKSRPTSQCGFTWPGPGKDWQDGPEPNRKATTARAAPERDADDFSLG
jgi:hypothetical protein